MKNVQIIDGADNCSYDVFEFSDEEFAIVFPEAGQDIEFIEDVIGRVGDLELGTILAPAWNRKVAKPDVRGIHGTLFFELEVKKKHYPTKRAAEAVTSHQN